MSLRISLLLTTAVLILSAFFLATPAHAAGVCDIYSASTGAPTGYGASYNVFKTSEMLVSILCNENESIKVTAGNNDPLTYIYKDGYYYNPSAKSWTKFSYSCDNMIVNSWCVGQVNKTLTDVPTDANNFLVSFTCQWSGSKWNCGCSNTSCSTAKWQIQGWRVAQSGGGGSGGGGSSGEGIIYQNDFDSSPLGLYTKSQARREFPNVDKYLHRGDPASVVEGSKAFRGRSLRLDLWEDTEFNLKFRIPNGGGDDIYMSYMYTTSPNFPRTSGKLAALNGDDYGENNYNNPGGHCITDNFGTMIHFNGKRAFGVNNYTFFHGMDDPCGGGQGMWWSGNNVEPMNDAHGVWRHIEIRVKVNTPGKDDGVLQAWRDGELMYNNTTMEWRKTNNTRVERAQFKGHTTGGNEPQSPGHYLYYDNFVISTTRQGPPPGI